MTNKNSTLTLSANKLSLSNKNVINVDNLKKAYADATHASTVEVKKNKAVSHFKTSTDQSDDSSNLTAQEVSRKLEILKNYSAESPYDSQSSNLYREINALNAHKNQKTEYHSGNVRVYSDHDKQQQKRNPENEPRANLSQTKKDFTDSNTSSKTEAQKPEAQKDFDYKKSGSFDRKPHIRSDNQGNTNYKKEKFQEPQSQPQDQKLNDNKHESLIDRYNKFRVELHDESQTANKNKKSSHKFAKSKRDPNARVNKSQIKNIFIDYDATNSERDSDNEYRSQSRFRRKDKRKHQQFQVQKVHKDIKCSLTIEVGELASLMGEKVTDVVKQLMKLGVMGGTTYVMDRDMIELIADSFGHSVTFIDTVTVESILETQIDDASVTSHRPPVVTIMGHVDHGKTSLLDALRSTDVVSTEAGGITQHIGAYQVHLQDGKSITFIDTPGHEAFTAMRSRGTKITDIVVLVVAANDSIKPQTVEAINHAKAAGVPIIVAINKIDRHDADPDRVKQDLLSHNIVPEDYGGDVVVVPVSALQKTNLDKLEESILLIAELLDLRAKYDTHASGAVIEAKVDKSRGPLVSVLVQRGTLKNGDIIVAGSTYGKVKLMTNEHKVRKKEVTPGIPIEIMGFNSTPVAGDKFVVVETEKEAREIADDYQSKIKASLSSKRTSLNDLIMQSAGNIKVLKLIIKADVQGSVEAIVASILKIDHPEVKAQILHSAVGGITESDVILAQASNALIIGFNVRANNTVSSLAEKSGVELKYYSIIYDMLDDVKTIMTGMISPITREIYLGTVDIRQVFDITKVGKVAGSYVTKGVIKRGAGVRLLRNDVVIYEGKLKTLKRFKEDVKEVKENFECGIVLENYEDIKVGDTIEVFEKVTTSGGKVS